MTVVNIADAPKVSKQEKLDIYCKCLADGWKREDAYVEAGYSPISAKTNAQKFHRQNHEYITSYFADHIGTHAPAALKVLLEIMNSEHEKGGIRLKAAQDLLDRAGYSAKQKIEVSTKTVDEMSTGELENELQDFLAKSPSWLASLLGKPVPDVSLIKLREGYKGYWYKDTLGKWTGGYGHLRVPGDPEKFTEAQANQWLDADLAKARKSALDECEQLPFYTKELLDVMVSVNYQLGTEWEHKFKNTFQLMKDGKFDEAAWAVESSLWHKQTPVRVRDLQRALWRTQALWEVYKAQ